MTEHEVSRTLVKSPPELWAELSDASSLARHLDQFGEIRITRLDPETAVAWEGERASGTVRIEPSGWGTLVILKATAGGVVEEAPAVEPAAKEVAAEKTVAVVDPEPVAVVDRGRVAPPPTEPAVPEAAVALEPEAVAPEPVAGPVPERVGFFARLRGMFGGRSVATEPEPTADEPEVAPEHEPVPEPEAVAEPEAPAVAVEPVEAPDPPVAQHGPPVDVALTAALDSLGQAHHRPFSRG